MYASTVTSGKFLYFKNSYDILRSKKIRGWTIDWTVHQNGNKNGWKYDPTKNLIDLSIKVAKLQNHPSLQAENSGPSWDGDKPSPCLAARKRAHLQLT